MYMIIKVKYGYMKSKRKVASYHAIFDPAIEGGYNVSFPALPGCVTFGRTFEKAQTMAEEVLELWLEELKAQHVALPTRSRHPIINEIQVRLPA